MTLRLHKPNILLLTTWAGDCTILIFFYLNKSFKETLYQINSMKVKKISEKPTRSSTALECTLVLRGSGWPADGAASLNLSSTGTPCPATIPPHQLKLFNKRGEAIRSEPRPPLSTQWTKPQPIVCLNVRRHVKAADVPPRLNQSKFNSLKINLCCSTLLKTSADEQKQHVWPVMGDFISEPAHFMFSPHTHTHMLQQQQHFLLGSEPSSD